MPVLSLAPSPYGTTPQFRQLSPVSDRHTVPAGEAPFLEQPGTALTLDLITERLAFNALEGEWTSLFERAGRPGQFFQSFGWLWHWCNHYLDPRDRRQSLAVVTGRRNGILVLACPFVVIRAGGLSTLTFMGDPVSQYGDVLVEAGPDASRDLSAAFDFVLRLAKPDLVHLRKVRADAAIAPLLKDRGAAQSCVQQAPYVAFDTMTDFDAFEARYPKAARKNRKRQLRRLNEVGRAEFVRLSGGDDAMKAIDVALTLKRNWLRQRGLVSPAVTDARTQAFFRDCASGRGPSSGVEVGAIVCNGEIAAIEIGVQTKDRVAIHLIAYDPRFEKTGAGALLMEDSIRRACQSGQAALDLLAPGAAYKFEWTDRSIDVGDWALGFSGLGKIYATLYLSRLRPAAKDFVEHLPSAFRRHFVSAAGVALVAANRGAIT